MRATWAVLGTLVLAGGVAYWKLRLMADEGRSAPPLERAVPTAPATPPLIPPETPAAAPRPAAASEAELAAEDLVRRLDQARRASDGALEARLSTELRSKGWDTPPARRYAVRRGLELAQASERLAGAERVRTADQARRLLSRGALLPDLFGPDGQPLPARAQLLQTIQRLNAQVMTHAGGLEGVTRAYTVPSGKTPVQIVTEERLTTGHNAVLLWNKRGNLDPRRLVAGETILLPLETLSVEIDLERRRLVLFLGEAYVKEFVVGVGKPDTPTPAGTFVVGDKQENPDWYAPQGGVIRAGDPRNELGRVWIPLLADGGRTGYGIHGTNQPDTVGSACSQGCVRLDDAEAFEVFWWVRTGRSGGQPTRVVIR